jgi:hypothetical protein
MFSLSTTRSADLPTSMEPVSSSRKLAVAPLMVYLRIICSTLARSSGAHTSPGAHAYGYQRNAPMAMSSRGDGGSTIGKSVDETTRIPRSKKLLSGIIVAHRFSPSVGRYAW